MEVIKFNFLISSLLTILGLTTMGGILDFLTVGSESGLVLRSALSRSTVKHVASNYSWYNYRLGSSLLHGFRRELKSLLVY